MVLVDRLQQIDPTVMNPTVHIRGIEPGFAIVIDGAIANLHKGISRYGSDHITPERHPAIIPFPGFTRQMPHPGKNICIIGQVLIFVVDIVHIRLDWRLGRLGVSLGRDEQGAANQTDSQS